MLFPNGRKFSLLNESLLTQSVDFRPSLGKPGSRFSSPIKARPNHATQMVPENSVMTLLISPVHERPEEGINNTILGTQDLIHYED